jgi:uncharacterized Tic20 family protein
MNDVIETPGTPDKDARTWAMVCHLSALVGFVIPGIGFVLGPLVVWALKRDDSPFIDAQGKEALNFQLTMFLAFVVSMVLVVVFVGLLLAAALAVAEVILIVIAAVKVTEGVDYRYPVNIRFIK